MSRWVFAQMTAYITLAASIMVLAFSLGQQHYYGLPLVVLLYGLHWRWQGVAFAIDYPKSEQFVAMVKHQPSRADPNF